jgi:hypothetical protein
VKVGRPAVALALLVPLVLGGCAAASTEHGGSSYGGMPKYLPKDAIRSDSVLTGTEKSPALTTEGDSVIVKSATGSVTATVSGPVVPGEGLPYQADATTCTWTIELKDATAPIPITVSDFTTIDHLGAIYRPLPVPGQPAPPATIEPGQTVTFELRAVMAVGEGLMRWAPGGGVTLASWDFEVEND